MKDNNITLAVITYGAYGAKAVFQGNEYPVAGIPAKVADTNGAGDAFWGGFLTSILDQGVTRSDEITSDHIEAALQYGNIAGWLAVQCFGAIPALPTRAQIEKALNQHIKEHTL